MSGEVVLRLKGSLMSFHLHSGGCIIRAKFLDVMQKAFRDNPNVENLLMIDR